MRSAARAAWLPIAIVTIGFVGWMLLMVTGHRTLVVMSGSMYPTLAPGDIAVVKAVGPSSVKVGDVVTFRDPTRDRELVTHRAVFIQPMGEATNFVTKGDQNSGIEEWTVESNGMIGRLSFRIPMLGTFLVWLRTPGVRAIMLGTALLLLGTAAIRFALQAGHEVLSRQALSVAALVTGLLFGAHAVSSTFASLSSQTANSANTFQAATSFCTPGSQTVYATADAWVDEDIPGANNGSGTTLSVKGGNPKARRTLALFALPTIKYCALQSATLQLYATASEGARTLQALRLDGAWTEGGVTWTNQPAVTGVPATTTNGTGWLSWNVTPAVAAMYAGTNHGFLVRDLNEGSAPDVQTFASRETAFAPALTVTYGSP